MRIFKNCLQIAAVPQSVPPLIYEFIE
jgi:hypothetical protein